MANAITSRVQRPALPVTAGDLIFIRPQPHDTTGQLIAEATGGPYCHVQAAVTSTSVVEALSRGVVESFIQVPPPPGDVASIGRGLDGVRLAHARTWLLAQVGREYSWTDILADVVGALVPARLGSRTPFLVAPSHLDCVELAARFLAHAGYEWLPDALFDYPERATPNGLARALSLLK